jgi:deoxycytidine triphosphate deaminase
MADQPSFSNRSEGTSETPKESGGWLAENVAKPLWNSLIVDTWNAVANAEHAGGRTPEPLQVGKLTRLQETQAEYGTAGWAAQGISRGVGSILPYVGSSLLAGGLLSKTSQVLRLGQGTEALLTSNFAANTGGAALFNGFRDTQEGETTWGNVAGGVTGMGIYSLVNPWMSKFTGSQIMARGLVGSLTAPAQMMASDYVAHNDVPSLNNFERYQQAAVSGLVFNSLLPGGQRLGTKAVDQTNLALGRGIPLTRYIEQNGLSGDAVRAANAALPDFAQFKMGNTWALNDYAPQMTHLRVQPSETAVNTPRRNLIYIREPEFTAIRPEDPPAGLQTQAERQKFNDVQRTMTEAQILAREVSQKYWTETGTAFGAATSNQGFRKMLVDGTVKISVRDENGNLQPYTPLARHVGPNSLDVQLGKVFFIQNDGQNISTVKADLKANVGKYTRVDQLETFNGQKGIWLEPRGQAGDRALGQTMQIFSMPPSNEGHFNLSPPAHADIEGTTWLARNNLRVHQTANTVHNGTDHPVTLEFVNESDNRMFLAVGENIGQMKFKPLDAHPEGVTQLSNTNGQTDSTGSHKP